MALPYLGVSPVMPPRTPEFIQKLPPVRFQEQLGDVLDRSADVILFGVKEEDPFGGGFAKDAGFYFPGAARRWEHRQHPKAALLWRAPAVYGLLIGWYDVPDLSIFRDSLAYVVKKVLPVAHPNAKVITLPRIGCNEDGGGFDYATQVRPIFAELFDDRFTVLMRAKAAKAGGRRKKATTFDVAYDDADDDADDV